MNETNPQAEAAIEAAAFSVLATHCCVCLLALRDPISVELGIGPICRKKLWDERAATVSAKHYARAKTLIYRLALNASANKVDLPFLMVASDELQEMGFHKLAETLVKRSAKIQVEARDTDRLFLHFPFNIDCGYELRRACAAVMEKNARGQVAGFVIPAVQKNSAWAILRKHFPGVMGVGPRGPFMIEVAA